MALLKGLTVLLIAGLYYSLRRYQAQIVARNEDMPQWARDLTDWLLFLTGCMFLLVSLLIVFL